MEFAKISEVQTLPNTSKAIFITFDLDWCIDPIFEYTLDLIEKYSVKKATFFVTHYTDLLHYLRKNNNMELGIHPNFNHLLQGEKKKKENNFKEVLDFYKEIVPEAVSVRTHSLTMSSIIINYLKEINLRLECSLFIPFDSNIILTPYNYLGIKKVPYYCGDFYLLANNNFKTGKRELLFRLLDYDGLKVFNFHPIHIFLNTDNIERYRQAKLYSDNYGLVKKYVNNSKYGIKDFFVDLIREVKSDYLQKS